MALTISRKPHEQIVLLLENGEEIVITLGETQGKQTKLSFEAPKTVEIFRSELLDIPNQDTR